MSTLCWDMSNPFDPRRRFLWRAYACALLIEFVVLAVMEVYWYMTSGGWQSYNVVVVAVFAWIDIVLAWRWREIRKTISSGAFSEADYRANPTAFYFGSTKTRLTAIVGGVVVVVLWSIYDVLSKSPR